MASYRTLKDDEAAKAVELVEGFEALVVDGKLTAIIAGPLRIYADKGSLVISQQEELKQ